MEKGQKSNIAFLEQNLYGVRLFEAAEFEDQAIEKYIETQEKTHIAEGLALQQRSSRILEFSAGCTRDFRGQSMVEVNKSGLEAAKRQYSAGDEAAWALVRRRYHDVKISERQDDLMQNGQIGEGFFAFSAFLEEFDIKAAKRLGDWPEYRRSFAWFCRKKSETELECVDISIDQSSVATYKKLLQNLEIEIGPDVKSYDLPQYFKDFKLESDDEFNNLISSILVRYKELNNDPIAKASSDAYEALEFINKHAKDYIKLMTALQREIADSLKIGVLKELVKLTAARALKTLNCLSASEIYGIRNLLAKNQVNAEDSESLSKLILAVRYGIWKELSDMVNGPPGTVQRAAYGSFGQIIQTGHLLNNIFGATNRAAGAHETMPGCGGGTSIKDSFLDQDPFDIKNSIFNRSESYKFDQEMFCVVCQSPPKKNEKPKMCGPCGICKVCDKKIRAQESKELKMNVA